MADNARVSQESVDALVLPDTQRARVSHVLTDVLVEPDTRKARVSHALADVLVEPTNRAGRISQASVDVLVKAPLVGTTLHQLFDVGAVARLRQLFDVGAQGSTLHQLFDVQGEPPAATLHQLFDIGGQPGSTLHQLFDVGGNVGARLHQLFDVLEASPSGNEVQVISGSGVITGGTYTLTFDGQTTAPIASGASAGAVQAALEALSNVAPGDLTVTGGPLDG